VGDAQERGRTSRLVRDGPALSRSFSSKRKKAYGVQSREEEVKKKGLFSVQQLEGSVPECADRGNRKK